MGTKNNPENRGLETSLRKFNGKTVKPVLFISGNRRYIAGAYEDSGELVIPQDEADPIAYAACATA